MIPLTLYPLICHPCDAEESAISANIQILTLYRAFLTAPSKRTRDNDNSGGNYETQHLAQLQSNCMDSVVLCDSHSHPPQLADVCVCVRKRMAIPCNSSATG